MAGEIVSRLCPRCAQPAAWHPFVFIDAGLSKLWLSGPWAPVSIRLYNWVCRIPCFDHRITRISAQTLCAEMVKEAQDAHATTTPIPTPEGEQC